MPERLFSLHSTESVWLQKGHLNWGRGRGEGGLGVKEEGGRVKGDRGGVRPDLCGYFWTGFCLDFLFLSSSALIVRGGGEWHWLGYS